MASFTTSPNSGVDFSNFDIDDLFGNYLFVANATTWRTGPSNLDPGTHVDFQGVGLTYSGGALTGGTINSITSTVAGDFDFQITGLSMSGATFNAYRLAGDSEGFLSAVFNGDDTITGSSQDDYLMAYAGNDKLVGNNGDDYLDGGAGSDTMTGGKGDDIYVIDSLTDVIIEAGGDSDDTVWTDFVNIDLNLAAFNGIENVGMHGYANLSVIGDTGWNEIHGNSGDNTLSGKTGDDEIWGGPGSDVLDGGTGKDELHGMDGNDTYYVDNAGDTVSEDKGFGGYDGIDTVISTKDFTLPVYVENLTLTGTAINGTGNTLANTLTGNASDNKLDGGTGYDTLIGGDGNDTYVVNNSKDVVVEISTGGKADMVLSDAFAFTLPSYVENLTLRGNASTSGNGNDLNNWILGNSGANKIDGGAGVDQLFGGDGNDTLIGGDGDDWLRGGLGNDKLDTSLGNDVVLVTSKLDGFDVIDGFDGDATGGQDLLGLYGYFEDLGVATEDRASRVGLIDSGAVVDVWIDTNGDNALDAKIAEVHTTDALKVGEDILVTALL